MAETLTMPSWWLDLFLCVLLLWVGWQLLATPDLRQAVICFIAFGLVLALVWVRLGAVDAALAEAAIGSGLTGALLWSTLARMERSRMGKRLPGSEEMKMEAAPVPDWGRRLDLRSLCAVLLVVVWSMLVLAILELPAPWPGLLPEVRAQLERSGVEHPVTAVLLNFRGYDTLLEVGVLFVAALGVWSLGFIAPGPADTPSSPLLSALIRMLAPILVLTSGYLLRRGAYAPGGAFQAGALLGAAGVLILLSDVPVSSAWFSWPLKTALTAGFGVFLGVALYPVLLGGVLLQYPVNRAGPLILLVEVTAAFSIAATLCVLFAGGRPRAAPSTMPEPGVHEGEEA